MSALSPVSGGATLAARRLAMVADPPSRDALDMAFAACGWPLAEPLGTDPEAAMAALQSGAPPTLLVIDIDAHDDPPATLARLAAPLLDGARLLALGSANDVALFRALLAAGASDYLPKPVTPEAIAAALRRICEDAAVPAAVAGGAGQMVAVIGVRGGCGASMVAASLGWAIANIEQRRGILVDLDLHFGSAADIFGLDPGPGLAALLAAPEVDGAAIEAALQPAGDRLGVLATTLPLGDTPAVPAAAATALATALRASADWTVIDLPRGLGDMTRTVLAAADQVVLVAPATLAGLRDAGRLANWLTRQRAGAAPLLVVNGGNEAADDLRRHLDDEGLGDAVAVWVPTLTGPAAAAQAHGLPLAAVAGGARGGNPFAALATLVTGTSDVAARARSPGWWPWRG